MTTGSIRKDEWASHPSEMQALVRDGFGVALVREGMLLDDQLATRPVSLLYARLRWGMGRRYENHCFPELPGDGSGRRLAMKSVGQTIFAFFEDYLMAQKGLRPGSIRSYRDTLKLFLAYVASSRGRPITRLTLPDLASQRVLDFLNMMEVTRGNRVSTRNQPCRLSSATSSFNRRFSSSNDFNRCASATSIPPNFCFQP